MGDAEIIPIGTRGRPGRGSGTRRPSSAARDLAPHAARRRAQDPDTGTGTDTGPDTGTDTGPDTATTVTGPRADERTTPAEQDVVARLEVPAPTSAGPSGVEVTDRAGAPGIPAADWAHALVAGAREVLGDDWENRLAHGLAGLRRRLTGEYAVDEYGFDAELTRRLLFAVLRPLAEKWFRIEVRGLENIPATGGALVVSNHSGTIPVDGLMTMFSVTEHTGRFLRPLGADLVFRTPVVAGLARKMGATLACTEDAERMLSGGELVGVWPEGFKGIGKPYSERYKLQRFGRGGFVSAAMRTGVPVIPVSVVGAEEIYPLVGNVPALARLLGLPYVPITPLFPLLGPLGLVPLPSKWLIEFGEPVRTDAYGEGAADDPMLVLNVTDQVRETIQQTLYSLLMERPSVFG
ncbi:lysophospholipid acyltransferase family protein [Nocardioides sp. CFH 31398]|uniref:lysophospholipid acyltransferase family protein n=1 Tax=Nocardioides sp. CFH 31398 TaxID=2919579 RepID=UPI001F05D712|nr:lysophospholipid acyltransferase family protein [Nocardioides sp. CFH 31398]MCH1865138.1 acyltransferase family protein [Nocardioides sp. CFH 31398]